MPLEARKFVVKCVVCAYVISKRSSRERERTTIKEGSLILRVAKKMSL